MSIFNEKLIVNIKNRQIRAEVGKKIIKHKSASGSMRISNELSGLFNGRSFRSNQYEDGDEFVEEESIKSKKRVLEE